MYPLPCTHPVHPRGIGLHRYTRAIGQRHAHSMAHACVQVALTHRFFVCYCAGSCTECLGSPASQAGGRHALPSRA